MSSGLYFHLENMNRMTLYPIYILKKNCKQEMRHPVQYFLLKETEDRFSHFYKNNFEIFKTYENAVGRY